MNKANSLPVPKRLYKDGISLSIIGFGGIIVCKEEQKVGDRYVAEAVDRGINYFDVAPSYFEGEAEIKQGIALKPYRDKVFLACKTGKRDAAGARAELETSLKRAHTDHFDLYQFHAVTTDEDVKAIIGPGGAGEVFLQAKKEGKVKYLGFSAHSVEAAFALMDAFPCDSILFPLNFVTLSQGNFGAQILERAKSKGVARLALKAMAGGTWGEKETHTYDKTWYKPAEDPQTRERALRFTLGLDISAAVPPGHYELFKEALEIACAYKPLSAAEQKELAETAKKYTPIFKFPSDKK